MKLVAISSHDQRPVGMGPPRKGQDTHVPTIAARAFGGNDNDFAKTIAPSRSAFLDGGEKEPGTLLGLVGPVVEHAGGRIVTGRVDRRLGLAQIFDQLLIVVVKRRQHIAGADIILVISSIR